MIGIVVKDHKIIAAVPVNGGESGHMIVVGKSLPQEGKRHAPHFVTWWTDGQGTFDSPIWFTDHRLTADQLRWAAMGNMIDRADWVLAGVVSQAMDDYAGALAALKER